MSLSLSRRSASPVWLPGQQKIRSSPEWSLSDRASGRQAKWWPRPSEWHRHKSLRKKINRVRTDEAPTPYSTFPRIVGQGRNVRRAGLVTKCDWKRVFRGQTFCFYVFPLIGALGAKSFFFCGQGGRSSFWVTSDASVFHGGGSIISNIVHKGGGWGWRVEVGVLNRGRALIRGKYGSCQ